MKKKNIPLGLLMMVLPVLMFFAVNLIVSFIVQMFYLPGIVSEGLASGRSMSELQDEAWLTEQLLNTSYPGVVTLINDGLLAVASFFWWKKIRTLEVPAPKAFNGKRLLFMALVGLALQGVLVLLMAIVFAILPASVAEGYEELSKNLVGDGSTSLFMALSVVIAAPICEEMLFRGLALNYGRRYINDVSAVVISSILFGCLHLANAGHSNINGVMVQVVYAALLGAVIALVVLKFKSVWAGVFIHFVVNGTGQLLSFVPSDNGMENVVSYILMAVGVAATVGAVFMLRRGMLEKTDAKTYGEIEEEKEAALASAEQ